MSLELDVTKAYSTASIGKAYLDAMGIRPPEVRPDPALVLCADAVTGASMQAYYGGRTEVRIRRTPVPVVYLDFLSMYPTVNALMGLWGYLTADHLEVVDATDAVREFLERVTLDDLFKPETWKRLPALVQIVPEGDILPVRGHWNLSEQSWQIGVNHLTSSTPLWYTLADAAASKLLTARAPHIVQAHRFVPQGRQRLRPVKLRGEIRIDPREQDFFRCVIEERARVRARMKNATGPEWEQLNRLQGFLKILANSTSYGVFAEMNQTDEPGNCTVWTGEPKSFPCEVLHPEELGRFCCPPLAATITGAARLMLAMLERCVSDLGGSYAMCDTDSMAVVATEQGGLVKGGSAGNTRRPAVQALSWVQVDGLVERFAALNPYDRDAVPGSVLKVEDENFALCDLPAHGQDTHGQTKQCICTRERRELRCFAISAKRYALYNLNDDGGPIMRKWSEHGLGYLVNPTDPASDDRDWMKRVWLDLVREAYGLSVEDPAWLDLPALSRITVSGWELYERLGGINRSAAYQAQVKPGNFLLLAQADLYMRPSDLEERPVLIAPFESDPRTWAGVAWIDRKSGRQFAITTDDREAGEGVVRVKSYREVLQAYRVHRESKSLGPDGEPCRAQSVGLLGRRHVSDASISHVGKETNKLEAVLSGEEDDPDEVYALYQPPGQRLEVLREALRKLPRKSVARQAGITRANLSRIIHGKAIPRAATMRRLERQIAQLFPSYTGDISK